jgi:hypothetical protein
MSTNQKGFTKKFLTLMSEIEKVCCGGENTLISIVTEDSPSITFSGSGTKRSPLTAIASSSVNANNGLSVLGGNIQFGQTVGAVGNPAILLHNSEIPQGGFDIFYSGIGNSIFGRTTSEGSKVQIQGSTGVNQSLLSLKLSNSYTIATPVVLVKDSTDLLIFEARFPVNGGFTSTFLGKNSGSHCTVNSVTGIGEDALAAVTTGTSNTAFGFRALRAVTTGLSNVAIGHASQGAMITGGRNITMGRTSLLNATIGDGNIVIGDSAQQECADGGSANVYIGFTTGGAAQGSQNVAVGAGAMFYQNAISGLTRPSTSNIAIGWRASFTVQLGTNNTVLGTSANVAGILGNNNILIGASTDSTSSITNTTLLGTGITTGLSNIAALSRGDQNTIIGVTNPTVDNGAKLQVAGDITTSAPTVGSIGKWKLGQFDNTPITATGRVKINVDGVDYWISAVAA